VYCEGYFKPLEGNTAEDGNKKGYKATLVQPKSKFLVGYTLAHKKRLILESLS